MKRTFFISIFLLFLFATVCHAKQLNVLNLAKELGFTSADEIDDLKRSIPAKRYQQAQFFDENQYRRVTEIFNKIKDFDHNNYQPQSREADGYAYAFRDLKYRINEYFQMREKVITAHKKQKNKRDIYTLLKKYNLPVELDGLRDIKYKYFDYQTEEALNDDLLYNKINGLYSEIENARERDFDRSEHNRKMIVGYVLGNFKLSMKDYLRARNNLKDKEALVKKEKESGGQNLVESYQSTPAPSMLSDLKDIVTKINGWKVVATRDIYLSKWNLSIDDNRYNNINLIFQNPPLDVSAYQNKYMIINAAITRKLEGQFVISPNNGSDEAFAKISKSTISKSAARFNQPMMMLCRLLDIIEAETVGGGTKVVSVLEVVTMVPIVHYSEFAKYVAGHPNEFPQQKYIKIQVPE